MSSPIMEYSKVFAVISAGDDSEETRAVIDHPRNMLWRTSERRVSDGISYTEISDSLVLMFDKIFRPPHNFHIESIKLGTASDSHVTLGHKTSAWMNRQQCYIIVSPDLRIFVVDYMSYYGMAVTYDGAVEDTPPKPSKTSQWIVADEPGSGQLLAGFTLHIGGAKLKLNFPNCEFETDRYIQKLKWLSEDHFDAAGRQLRGPHLRPANYPCLGNGDQYYLCNVRKSKILTTVYDAVRAHDGKVVAIKEFTPPPGNPGIQCRANIQREFRFLADVRHKNIIKSYTLFDGETPRITMELIRNGDLSRVLLDKKTIRTVFWQMLEALDYLQERGIIHHNTRPENILLEAGEYPRAVLTGFGSAMYARSSSHRGEIREVEYAAPEMFPDVPYRQTEAIDIWALAVTMIKLLYRHPHIPLMPSVPPETSVSISPLSSWALWVDSWSLALKDHLRKRSRDDVSRILRRMLEFDPRDRWAPRECLQEGRRLHLVTRRDSFLFSVH